MRILILGDVMGLSGRKALKKNLSNIIKENEIDFSVINGENSADDGKGITKDIADEFFSAGIDVITSGIILGRRYRKTKASEFGGGFSRERLWNLFFKK